MKNLVLALATAAALCVAGLAAAPSPAHAAGSCSNFVQTGPILGGGVDMGFVATCSVQFDVNIVPQYESGGTWHRATKAGVGAGFELGPYSAGGQRSDHHLFQGLDQTPYCSFNWRASTGVFNHATGDNIAGGIGPTLHKSC